MDNIIGIVSSLTVLIGGITALIIALINGYFKTKKELDDNLPKKIVKQSGIDVNIIQQMEELKEALNADRIQIYDFHNGGRYANGRSALKTSCTYEVVRAGIRPVQRELQNIPLSCISKFTATILEDGYIEVCDIEEIKDIMPATYQLKKDMGLTAFYDIAILNVYNEAIGFLAVQYIKNKYYCTDEEQKRQVLKLKFFIEAALAKTGNK